VADQLHFLIAHIDALQQVVNALKEHQATSNDTVVTQATANTHSISTADEDFP